MSTAKVVDPAQADGEARFLASLDGSSGVSNGTAGKENDESFDTESEARLALLNKDMQDQVRVLLRRAAPAQGYANPENYSPASRHMVLRSLADAVEAREASGLTTFKLEELAFPETVAAIETLIGVRWSTIRAGMILADIRKLVRLQTHSMPALVNERQKELAATDRRNIDHRVFPTGDYLRGAQVLAAIARVLEDDNRVRGFTFRRDAGMLALQAKGHLRLRELYNLNVGHLKTRILKNGRRILTVSVTMTKVNGSRSVPIGAPDVIALLDTLRDGSSDTPLWRNSDGSRMSYCGVAYALARTGNLAVGEQAGSNIMRRAAMLDANTAEQRQILLGHGVRSRTAERFYRRNESAEGKTAMERGSQEMAARVAARRSNTPLRRIQPRSKR